MPSGAEKAARDAGMSLPAYLNKVEKKVLAGSKLTNQEVLVGISLGLEVKGKVMEGYTPTSSALYTGRVQTYKTIDDCLRAWSADHGGKIPRIGV